MSDPTKTGYQLPHEPEDLVLKRVVEFVNKRVRRDSSHIFFNGPSATLSLRPLPVRHTSPEAVDLLEEERQALSYMIRAFLAENQVGDGSAGVSRLLTKHAKLQGRECIINEELQQLEARRKSLEEEKTLLLLRKALVKELLEEAGVPHDAG